MKRSPATYLADVLEASTAIEEALRGVSLTRFKDSPAIWSVVEREFAVIDEAIRTLDGIAPHLSALVPESQRILDYRYAETYEHSGADIELAYEYALADLANLKRVCEDLQGKIAGQEL